MQKSGKRQVREDVTSFWDKTEPPEHTSPFVELDDRPTFKPGTVMTYTGIYVDENGSLWHVDPFEGSIELIISDEEIDD